MANGVKYLLMTFVFLGVVKLLQVTSFDGEKYDALVKKSENRIVKEASNNKKKPVTKSPPAAKKVEKKPILKEEDRVLNELKESYLDPILEQLPPDGLRKDIFIRYYRHNKDGIGVYKLEEMGYYMHQKPATETAGLGSNIIYYGDDVPLEDIQIVALTLLKEGIPLKSIEHTTFEWKSSAIEIGTDTYIQDQPNLTLGQILDFHKLYLGSY